MFFDLEAGDLAIEGWPGDTIRPRTWSECRDFAVFIGGPNPALRDDQVYSRAHYEAVTERFGDPAALDRYETVFIDSITVAGRLCFQWCKGQPQAFSDRNGKPDMRGAYGLHGQEMIAWLTHLQHTRGKNVWFVGILDEKLDDFNRRVFSPQIEGSKTGNELPGIVDEVIVMAEIGQADADPYRAFVCRTLNPLRLSRQGPQRASRCDRGASSRPPDGKDRRPRQTGERAAGVRLSDAAQGHRPTRRIPRHPGR